MDDYEDILILHDELSRDFSSDGLKITVGDVEEALRSLVDDGLVDLFRPDQNKKYLERQTNLSFSSEEDPHELYFFRSQSGEKLIESLPEDWFDSINSRLKAIGTEGSPNPKN